MKITRHQLQQLVKEEITRLHEEDDSESDEILVTLARLIDEFDALLMVLDQHPGMGGRLSTVSVVELEKMRARLSSDYGVLSDDS